MVPQRKSAEGVALGECLRSARTRAGLRQEDLARLVGMGTSTLRQIESGNATGTSIFTVFGILKAAGAPLAELDSVYSAARPEGVHEPPG